MIPVIEYNSDLENFRFKLQLFKAVNRADLTEKEYRKLGRLLERLKLSMKEFDNYDTILFTDGIKADSTLTNTVKTLALILDLLQEAELETVEKEELIELAESLINGLTPYNDLSVTS